MSVTHTLLRELGRPEQLAVHKAVSFELRNKNASSDWDGLSHGLLYTSI